MPGTGRRIRPSGCSITRAGTPPPRWAWCAGSGRPGWRPLPARARRGGQVIRAIDETGQEKAGRAAGRGGGQSGELGDCFLGAGIVDEVLAVGGGRDERGDSGVVEGAGQPVGDAVQPGGGVVGEQRLHATNCKC